MYRVMLDLETLSTRDNALILSIGAVEFGLEGVSREFYQVAKEDKQESKWGRHVDPDTKKWWSGQSSDARKVFWDPSGKYLDAALQDFVGWVGGRPVDELWGNGSDFDNVVLRDAYRAAGLPAPWGFRANRCFRTLKNLGVTLQPGDGIARTTHHNALDDAKVQAYEAASYLRYIKLGQAAISSTAYKRGT